jgi:hypothetical protein
MNPTNVGGLRSRDGEVTPTSLMSCFDFKHGGKQQHGVDLAVDYFALYQDATASPGEDDAAGDVAKLFSYWQLANRGTSSAGT